MARRGEQQQARSTPAPSASRQARRREETRGKLLEAARALTLERPIESMTIADITTRADVGFGSFYNHFESKEAILEATTEREAELLQNAMAQAIEAETDPAARLAFAVRYVAQHTLADPMWRWFFRHSSYGFLAIRRAMGPAFALDLAAGKRDGRFAFDDAASAAEFVFGGMLAVFAAAVAGRFDEARATHAVVLVLRALGVPDASVLARKTLPPIRPPSKR